MLTLKDFTFDFDQKGLFQFYGKPGHGKTAVLIEFATQAVSKDMKVVFIDCSAQISMKRFKAYLSREDMQKVVFFLPKSLKELLRTVDNLELLGLYKQACVCVDNMFFYYTDPRGKIGDDKVLRYYAYILSILARISKNSPVIVTNNSFKHDETIARPFNEFMTAKWIHCNFFLKKGKEGEIYLENIG
ncbi:MAG: hypothetical protein ACFFD4_23160 [Candidatus Odinarchaeota archaeon]